MSSAMLSKKVCILSGLAILTGAMLLLPQSVRAASKSDAASAAKPANLSIVEKVLEDDGEFDVLQAAVIRAGLVDALSSSRQLTVFAPTDQAFINHLIASDENDAISKIEALDKATLTNVLAYHVTSGRHTSTSVLARSNYRMLNGGTLNRTSLLGAGIAQANISASNGVIHAINSVLIP